MAVQSFVEGGSPVLNYANHPYGSMMIWVKPTSVIGFPGNGIFSHGSNVSAHDRYSIYGSSSELLQMNIHDGTSELTVDDDTTFIEDRWYCLIFRNGSSTDHEFDVYDPTANRTFNGSSASSKTAAPLHEITIGNAFDGGFTARSFHGLMAEAILAEERWTDAQVLRLQEGEWPRGVSNNTVFYCSYRTKDWRDEISGRAPTNITEMYFSEDHPPVNHPIERPSEIKPTSLVLRTPCRASEETHTAAAFTAGTSEDPKLICPNQSLVGRLIETGELTFSCWVYLKTSNFWQAAVAISAVGGADQFTLYSKDSSGFARQSPVRLRFFQRRIPSFFHSHHPLPGSLSA